MKSLIRIALMALAVVTLASSARADLPPRDAGADGSGSSKDDSGSCAMSAGPGAAGPWLLGVLFASLTLLWRRRRG